MHSDKLDFICNKICIESSACTLDLHYVNILQLADLIRPIDGRTRTDTDIVFLINDFLKININSPLLSFLLMLNHSIVLWHLEDSNIQVSLFQMGGSFQGNKEFTHVKKIVIELILFNTWLLQMYFPQIWKLKISTGNYSQFTSHFPCCTYWGLKVKFICYFLIVYFYIDNGVSTVLPLGNG